ncbi:hypothetical protein, partial [Paenibacillus sp. O199]|uniref:hypothetical protein n=1 Tax=Paenibacillus sp. O199 TaxID=1643925 RepID=UPI001967609D
GGSSPLDRIIRTIKKKLPVWEASFFCFIYSTDGPDKKRSPDSPECMLILSAGVGWPLLVI